MNPITIFMNALKKEVTPNLIEITMTVSDGVSGEKKHSVTWVTEKAWAFQEMNERMAKTTPVFSLYEYNWDFSFRKPD